ncbi:hypothetical protein Mame01_40370 [Microbispora amethystogenes]|nr:hypothetical protein Mame01_40370 [Microbispora amethystogenes]
MGGEESPAAVNAAVNEVTGASGSGTMDCHPILCTPPPRAPFSTAGPSLGVLT